MFMRRLATFVVFIFLDDYLGMDVLVTVNCLFFLWGMIYHVQLSEQRRRARERERKLEIMS